MAWRTKTIFLPRAAVAQLVPLECWGQLNLIERRGIAAQIADAAGETSLGLALLQGNPNLCQIELEPEVVYLN